MLREEIQVLSKQQPPEAASTRTPPTAREWWWLFQFVYRTGAVGGTSESFTPTLPLQKSLSFLVKNHKTSQAQTTQAVDGPSSPEFPKTLWSSWNWAPGVGGKKTGISHACRRSAPIEVPLLMLNIAKLEYFLLKEKDNLPVIRMSHIRCVFLASCKCFAVEVTSILRRKALDSLPQPPQASALEERALSLRKLEALDPSSANPRSSIQQPSPTQFPYQDSSLPSSSPTTSS